jgi:hypothetical protein
MRRVDLKALLRREGWTDTGEHGGRQLQECLRGTGHNFQLLRNRRRPGACIAFTAVSRPDRRSATQSRPVNTS